MPNRPDSRDSRRLNPKGTVMVMERKSRAYKTCERILKRLIEQYGPTARISWLLVRKAIKEIAGHDSRTVRNYLESLCEFKMLIPTANSLNDVLQDIQAGHYHVFELNWQKVADYRQLTMKDVEVEVTETVEK